MKKFKENTIIVKIYSLLIQLQKYNDELINVNKLRTIWKNKLKFFSINFI